MTVVYSGECTEVGDHVDMHCCMIEVRHMSSRGALHSCYIVYTCTAKMKCKTLFLQIVAISHWPENSQQYAVACTLQYYAHIYYTHKDDAS